MDLRRPAPMTNFNDGSKYEELKKSISAAALNEPEANPSAGLECNICFDIAQDPVVTLCGHLYCWPCIYRWINVNNDSVEKPDHQIPQCPVCKSEVSDKMVIPLYGRGQTLETPKDKLSHLIPQRPPSPRCNGTMILPNGTSNSSTPLHQRRYVAAPSPLAPPPVAPVLGYGGSSTPLAEPMLGQGGSSTPLADPMIGMFGEMVYARIFGNSEATLYAYPNSYHLSGSNTLRLRRRMMQTDRSLSRLCFFFCCCMILCLILF